MAEDLLLLEHTSGRPVTDNSLAAYAAQELASSQNWSGSEWRESIKQSLNYLLLRKKGDEVPGRSEFQSGDVADMLDHVQAEIQPMFAVPELVKISEEGQGDEQQAEQETAALNWYWRERLRGFEKLDEALQDALLSRNGFLKVWYEESFGLPYEQEVEGTELEIDATIAELADESRVEPMDDEAELVQDEVVQRLRLVDPADGITTTDIDLVVQPAVYRVNLFVTPVIKEVRGDCPAPEDMFVSKDASSTNMQLPRFVAQRRRMARQDIKALGLDPIQVNRIPSTSTYDSDVRTARKSDYNTYSRWSPHQSGELCDLFECYYRIDRDGDGIPELWKFFYSNNQEIMDYAPSVEYPEGRSTAEMVRVRPFACGSPMRVAHRHQGRSLFDKEQAIEDWKRHMLRQLADNLEEGNNLTTIYGPGVNEEDIAETEVGKNIYSEQGPNMVGHVPFDPNVATGSLAGLSYADKIRRERGGSAIDTSTESMPVNQAAHSTERIMSAMEKLVGMYARNMTETLVRDMFVLLHEQLKLMPGKIAFQVGNEWAEVEPRRWVQRTRISVTPGMSEGEKMRRVGGLNRVIEIQGLDAQTNPGVLVDEQAQYEARLDLYRAQGLANPEQYVVDPQSPQAEQARQRNAEAAQQAQMMAMMQQRMLFESQERMIQIQEQTKRMGNALKALEQQRDRLADYTSDMTGYEVDLAKAGIPAEIPMGQLGERDEGIVQ